MTKNTCSCSVWTNGLEGTKCPDCGETVVEVVLNESVIESLKEIC
jgi:DNA polymerase II large subunit